MPINSRSKGVRGELEVRDILIAHGYEARRGQQFAGGGDSPDVVHSIEGVHIEVKYVERLSIYDAFEQASKDAPEGSMPVVFHRRSNKPWLVILDADEFMYLLKDAGL